MKKQNTGLWILVYALLILDIGINAVRAQNAIPKEIDTQQMQIVDSAGNDRIDMSVTSEGIPLLALKDAQGHVRIGLLVASDGARLGMLDENGKTTLLVNGSSAPSLDISRDGKPAALFALASGTDPTLDLLDSAGKDRLIASYRPATGNSFVLLTDKEGKQAAELAMEPGFAIADVADQANTPRAVLKCTTAGAPSLYVADQSGRSVWSKTGQ